MVCQPRAPAASRHAGPDRAVPPLDAGGTRARSLDCLSAALGRGRVLPHLRHRRHPRPKPCRVRSAPARSRGFPNPRSESPPVRGSPGSSAVVEQRERRLLGLLGLRIFEATGINIQDFREVHGHRVVQITGKGGKLPLCRSRPPSPERSSRPWPVASDTTARATTSTVMRTTCWRPAWRQRADRMRRECAQSGT